MSFSSEVKAELCRTALSRRCCAQAEAYGVLLYCNQFTASQVRISTESNAFAARLPALFHRAFQLSFDRTPEEGAAKRIFSITEPDKLSALWSAFGHEPAGTLAQLAELCEPPVSKSAFNHRLRKLMEMARA